MSNAVLIVEDHENVRLAIRDYLTARGCTVTECDTWRAAETILARGGIDAAVIDYLLSDGNAIERMPRLRAAAPNVPLVVLTGHGSIDLAVRAMKEGAEYFLTKPVDLAAVWLVLQRALEGARARRIDSANKAVRVRERIDPFLGTSRAIRELEERARLVASTDSPVLIQGETGTGKGVLARWLHEHGPRSAEPFVDLNCAGLSKEFLESELFGHEKGAFTGALSTKPGLLETANRGTVFLDEIGDIDPAVQPRLLKVLEEKQFRRMGDVRTRTVDIRLIAATHDDLQTLVAEHRFREDLYFRISTIPLRMPALRERVEDIPALAASLLHGLRADTTLEHSVATALQKHAWPGNVRELRNVLERAVLLARGGAISVDHLLFDNTRQGREPDTNGLTLEEIERVHVERALAAERGRVERAAARLGIARSSLYYRIRKFGIDLSQF